MVVSKTTTTKQPIYNMIDEAFGGTLPGGVKLAGAADPQARADREAQAACVAQGGQWDPSRRICIMPNTIKNQTETEAPKENQPQNNDQILRNESGRPAGITVGGKTYLGLSPSDVEKMAAAELAKKGGAATQAFETGAVMQQQQAEQQQIQQQAAMQAQNIGLSPQEIANIQSGVQEAPINYGQAVTAGLANVIPSTIGGAVGGAAIGAVGSAGAASVPLAIAGGIGGFVTGLFTGIKNNIKSQQTGEIAKTKDILTAAKTNMRQIATIAAKDPSNAAEYVQAYNMQLALVYQAQAKLKAETSGNLNSFMNDGTQDLSDFELFLMPNGYADIYKQKLYLALSNGVSPEFTAEDLESVS